MSMKMELNSKKTSHRKAAHEAIALDCDRQVLTYVFTDE